MSAINPSPEEMRLDLMASISESIQAVSKEKETMKEEEEGVKGEKENVKQAQPTGGTGAPVIG